MNDKVNSWNSPVGTGDVSLTNRSVDMRSSNLTGVSWHWSAFFTVSMSVLPAVYHQLRNTDAANVYTRQALVTQAGEGGTVSQPRKNG